MTGQTEQAAPRNRHRRILLIANETCPDTGLCERIREIAGGPNGEVLVVAPALNERMRHYVSDTDAAEAAARNRLALSLERLTALGLSPHGEVGDADPMWAIDDALDTFDPDEIVIATHPAGRSNWLERDVVRRVRKRYSLPVTHLVVDGEPVTAPRS